MVEHADYLVGWLDAAALEQVVLLGNSFGCQVAVDLAVRYPEHVRSLVLASPTTRPDGADRMTAGPAPVPPESAAR